MTPIDLYRFVMGTDVWTLTPLDSAVYADVGFGNERFDPIPLGRGTIEQKSELARANLEIRIPIDFEIAVSLLTSFSEQRMGLTIFTDRDGTVETSWKGRLANIKPDDAHLTLNFESIFTSLRRPGLRARMQKSCRHALYERGCEIDPEAFAWNSELVSIAGKVVTVNNADLAGAGYFVGGMIRDPDGFLGYIIAHNGNQLTLQRVPYSLAQALSGTPPIAVTLYPGCNHTRTICHAIFNNRDRYGGFDWIPSKNPMGGNSIA